MVSFTHEHTVICRQLFAVHVVGSRPTKRRKHLQRMIIVVMRACKMLSNEFKKKNHKNVSLKDAIWQQQRHC